MSSATCISLSYHKLGMMSMLLTLQRKAWVRWKQFHIRARRYKQAQRKGHASRLAPVLSAWRARAHKVHRAKTFAKLLALKAQHR